MRCVHIAIRRANAGRTRRRLLLLLLSGHGEGSAHMMAGHAKAFVSNLSGCESRDSSKSDDRCAGGRRVNGIM